MKTYYIRYRIPGWFGAAEAGGIFQGNLDTVVGYGRMVDYLMTHEKAKEIQLLWWKELEG